MNQAQQALAVIQILGSAIKEAGEIPSGTLYAMVMGKISYETYTSAIALLVRQGIIKESNHLLTWSVK